MNGMIDRASDLEDDVTHELYSRSERRELARADALLEDDAEVLA